MTIILDPSSGKFYSLCWHEFDDFEKLQCKEIPLEQVNELCTNSHDYVKIQDINIALYEAEK